MVEIPRIQPAIWSNAEGRGLLYVWIDGERHGIEMNLLGLSRLVEEASVEIRRRMEVSGV